MIDNYDSFTYNIVQYLGELGSEPTVYRNDRITINEIKQLKPKKIIISPGPCTPNEAGISVDVIKHFYKSIPILGGLSWSSKYWASIRRRGRQSKKNYAWKGFYD